jgi:apolipoprotein D and lipocalin family protein
MAVHKFLAICATSPWLAAAAFVPNSVSAHPPPEKPPLQTVSCVDLVRYMGTWYEIARTPNRFENKCAANVGVYYELNEEGKVNLRNQCRLQNGSTDTAQRRGSVVDPPGIQS